MTPNEKAPQTWKIRLPVALAVGLAVPFTFIVFGMVDVFLNNRGVIPFPVTAILGGVLLIALAVWVCVAGGLLLLKGRLFDAAVSLVFGLLLAGYIQGNFLNLNLGLMTGVDIPWSRYTVHGMLNALIWGTIVAIPFVVRRLSVKIWRAGVQFLSWLLVGMQFMGLAVPLVTSGALHDQIEGQYLSMADAYEVSTRDNVLVFLIDRLDAAYLEDVLDNVPDFFTPLDGFTYYSDNTSVYSRTFPSVSAMLTGQDYVFDRPRDQYLREAWREGLFVPTLREHGYTVKLYMPERYAYWDAGDLAGLADNLRVNQGDAYVKQRPAIQSFALMSAYRFSPHVLKRFFWRQTPAFNRLLVVPNEADAYDESNYAFYQGLQKNGLTTQSQTHNFAYYHLQGSHDQEIDENIQRADAQHPTSQRQNLMGCFRIVFDYLDRLRALGLYDGATIAILGDHGKSMDHYNLDSPVRTAVLFKPKGSTGMPMAQSGAPTSHADFRASVLDAVGIDATGFGTPYRSIDEQAARERTYYYQVNLLEERRSYIEQFTVEGSARIFDHWHKTQEIDMRYGE